jgi:hypothetical protein
MSNGTFAVALVVGAALLALWLDQRLPRLAPAGLQAIVLHGLVAFAALQLSPANFGSPATAFLILFGLILPALVYVFLVAVWAIRLMQGALGLGARS